MSAVTPDRLDPDALPSFLTRSDLERLLQVGERTLRRWVTNEFLPPPVKLNGRNRWRRDDVRQFLARLSNTPAATAPLSHSPVETAGSRPASHP